MKKILRVVFSVILCISALTSCKNETGETIIIESETTETTVKETEELTTPEITTEETTETTTEETTETTPDETEEATPEETTLTIPDEETILASLSDEEKEVWLSMPDIVTMRMLKRRDEDDNFLYTEVIYIDKMGQTKKFISPDKPKPNDVDESVKWLNEQISQNEDANLINVADIHTLIEFYRSFMRIDKDSKSYLRYARTLGEYIERHYWFEIYGMRNDGKNGFETVQIADGNAGIYYLRRNNTNEEEFLDKSGSESFDLYLKLEPFMIDIPGGIGHLVGEEG